MLGTWRLILALFVVNAHLWNPWWIGAFAVISFFVISGYLMTFIMNQNYSYSKAGFLGFWENRALRLYPSYFAALALSLLIIFALPSDFVTGWSRKISLPDTIYEWFANIFIWGLFHAPEPGGTMIQVPLVGPLRIPPTSSLIPPAWALAIELIYYLLISAWFGRTMMRSCLLLGLGVAYLCWVYATLGKYYVYFSPLSAALPFGFGAVLYHLLERPGWRGFIEKRLFIFLVVAVTLYLAVLYAGTQSINNWRLGAAFQRTMILNVLASTFLLSVLVCIKGGGRFRKIDSFLGDLSYPTYLMHWQAGIIVAWFLGVTHKTLEFYLFAIVTVLLLSILDREYIGKPITALRNRVKARMRARTGDETGSAY